MSIAEKLVTVSENASRAVELNRDLETILVGGDTGGKSEMDEFWENYGGEIIEKTATGTGWLMVDDVSEIPHKCTLSVNGDTEVVVRGKNLLPFPYDSISNTTNGVTFTVREDQGITVNGTSSGAMMALDRSGSWLVDGVTYTLSANSGSSNVRCLAYYLDDSGVAKYQGTFTWKEGYTFKYVYLQVVNGTTVTNVVAYPQVEIGKTHTGYEPCKGGIYNITANQLIEINSISPYMNIITNPADVNISLTYNKSWGMQTEYDRFWDAYQTNGARVNYECGFRGLGWTEENFKPKYDIKPTNATSMFRSCVIDIDFVEFLTSLGITFDLSKATTIAEAFMSCWFNHLGVVDCTSCAALTNLFCSSRAKTIDKWILKEDGTNTFLQTFRENRYLENITIEGAIGNNIDFSTCPLTHDSLMSIITHLADKTGTTTKPVLTIGTTNYNKLTAEEIKIATDKNWEVV